MEKQLQRHSTGNAARARDGEDTKLKGHEGSTRTLLDLCQLALEVDEIEVGHTKNAEMPINARHIKFRRVRTLGGKKVLFHTMMNIMYGVFLFINERKPATVAGDPIH